MIRCGYVDIAAGQVHYRHVAGEGLPILFFHQSGSSAKMWDKVMTRLDGGRPMFAFDMAGYGGSFDPDPERDPTMADYVDWQAAAVAALGISRAHLVGHHTGSCVAVELAARHPALAQSLTMAGPVPLTPEERAEFAKHFGTPFTPRASGGYLLDNWHYLHNLGAHADVMLHHRELVDTLRAWFTRVQSYNAVWGQDFAGFLMAVQAPMLLMAAEDDVLYPFLARALAMRPDAESWPVKGANFEPDLDPDGFAAGLSAFVAKHG
ncbi:alpha/beta fold hydrolase [Sandaracinobacteroides saxicola]|uniref:Alpha/beta fold hydrolase n=1 Tax=Sandaracinobacteroides saxicola TaxID=2759707 RepID=A0A7G5II85_9SPHN|nr:alpha/beta fold hydrolase [Sandaracinobacteroides saxicola]QMW23077.1 alpha/beta fold hydrolase [Sandaracinobacteroides saxicola]